MRFVICGAGAIGGVIGGQLAKAGKDVIYIEKLQDHADALRQNGLQLRGVHGNHTLRIPVVTQASEIDFRADDAIFLAVKSFHSDAACQELRQATSLELPIFCSQNGVRNEETAAHYFQNVNGVMVLIGAKRLEPGVVVQTGNGPVGVGTFPEGLSQAAKDVAAALDETDLPVYTTDQVAKHKWNKMLVNLNNASMGLTGFASQEARSDATARLWLADVYEEGARVLQAAGIAYEGPPGMGPVEERIRELRDPDFDPGVPEEDELKGRASLWQDLYHQRGEVEADYFNGEIVRLGRQYNVPTPYSSLLVDLIKEMAAARELPGKYTIEQLRELLQD
ncbi:MAG: 2-dehydropantoate 2-reductase [Candidatus Tectomicrobia bacterium]|nr:2-dehydropantoate 2-reductase [Candidatus Tectomicrobia bacterium]